MYGAGRCGEEWGVMAEILSRPTARSKWKVGWRGIVQGVVIPCLHLQIDLIALAILRPNITWYAKLDKMRRDQTVNIWNSQAS